MVSGQSPSERTAAEAAAWLARLESTGRTEATEAGLRAWLDADASHRGAFEKAMDLWAILPGAAALRDGGESAADPLPVFRNRIGARARSLALVASFLIVALVSGWWLMQQPTGYATAIGEQKVATLEDGTRIALNTDTHLSVRYEEAARKIVMDDGEAMFEVARNPARPFVVTAGNKSVTAIGTSFIVRKAGNAVTVTLISGKVRVDTYSSPAAARPVQSTMLTPGERFAAAADTAAMVTPVSSEAATAWRRGQVMFNDTPLSAAIAELNRYGGPQVDIADPRLGALTVSGVFATNDTAEFADAVAALHGLNVDRDAGRIRLGR
nr:FecR family protein [Sphingopyxis italica]